MVNKFFHVRRRQKLEPPRNGQCRVEVAHSITYNGGCHINGRWYQGIKVPPPVVPKGYQLVGIGSGSFMMSRPPTCTMVLLKA